MGIVNEYGNHIDIPGSKGLHGNQTVSLCEQNYIQQLKQNNR